MGEPGVGEFPRQEQSGFHPVRYIKEKYSQVKGNLQERRAKPDDVSEQISNTILGMRDFIRGENPERSAGVASFVMESTHKEKNGRQQVRNDSKKVNVQFRPYDPERLDGEIEMEVSNVKWADGGTVHFRVGEYGSWYAMVGDRIFGPWSPDGVIPDYTKSGQEDLRKLRALALEVDRFVRGNDIHEDKKTLEELESIEDSFKNLLLNLSSRDDSVKEHYKMARPSTSSLFPGKTFIANRFRALTHKDISEADSGDFYRFGPIEDSLPLFTLLSSSKGTLTKDNKLPEPRADLYYELFVHRNGDGSAKVYFATYSQLMEAVDFKSGRILRGSNTTIGPDYHLDFTSNGKLANIPYKTTEVANWLHAISIPNFSGPIDHPREYVWDNGTLKLTSYGLRHLLEIINDKREYESDHFRDILDLIIKKKLVKHEFLDEDGELSIPVEVNDNQFATEDIPLDDLLSDRDKSKRKNE